MGLSGMEKALGVDLFLGLGKVISWEFPSVSEWMRMPTHEKPMS